MRRSTALIAMLVLLLAACGSDSTAPVFSPLPTATTAPTPTATPDPTPTAEATQDPDPTPTAEATQDPDATPTAEATIEPVDVPGPVDLSNPAFSSSDRLTTAGLGDLYFGMTPDEAAAAAATVWTGGPSEGTPRCYLLAPANGPSGIVFTVYNSSIERVDITNPSISTRSGASVGSTEGQLFELFGINLVVTPAASGGNSIAFVPTDTSDVAYRVIFETNGSTVTSMRAGRLPAVAPADPCG